MVPELKKSFFLLCDVIITFLVLGPTTTRWSIEISFPTVAMAVSSLDLEALCLKFALDVWTSSIESGLGSLNLGVWNRSLESGLGSLYFESRIRTCSPESLLGVQSLDFRI